MFFLAPEALRVDTSDLIQDSKNAQDSYVPMHFGGGRELVLALDSALEAPKSSKRTDRHFGHAPKTQRDPPSNDTSELQVSTSIPIQPQTLKNARNLLETNRTEEACKYAEIAREKGDFDPKLLKFLGQCYMRLAMPQTAERYYRDYLVAEPDAADAPFIQAIVRARVSGKSLRNIDSPTVRAERSGQDSK